MAGMTFSVLMSGEKCLSISLFVPVFFSLFVNLTFRWYSRNLRTDPPSFGEAKQVRGHATQVRVSFRY